MRTEKKAKIETTYGEALGLVGFARGIACAPAMDKALMDHMAGRAIGDHRNQPEMMAWLRGWTKANLAAQS